MPETNQVAKNLKKRKNRDHKQKKVSSTEKKNNKKIKSCENERVK